jgi:hypothetical protein
MERLEVLTAILLLAVVVSLRVDDRACCCVSHLIAQATHKRVQSLYCGRPSAIAHTCPQTR